MQEVQEFYHQKNMVKDSEAGLLNDLGNYYRTETMMLTTQLKEALDNGKLTHAKKAKGRKDRLSDIPPASGSQAQRSTPSDDPSGLMDVVSRRRKARGIRPDGGIR